MKKQKHFNIWKWAFIGLLIIILSFVVFISLKITVPSVSQSSLPAIEETSKSYSVVELSMNKENFSDTINYLLQKNNKDSQISYRFILKKNAILMATTNVLGKKVTFSVNAKPEFKNGNIILDVKSINAGSLNTPSKFILKYIQNNYDLKGIIQINAKQNKITICLDRLTGKNAIQLRAEKLNLKQNEIQFKVLIPKEVK